MTRPARPTVTRIASLKSLEAFRHHLATLGLDLPCEDRLTARDDSPLAAPVPAVTINGKPIGNRWAIQPMEGWDASTLGEPTDLVQRRWERFGLSGAKLIAGGEAMAVRADSRANPRQLLITDATADSLGTLVRTLVTAHSTRYGTSEDLVIGFQLTHSGRFCRPRADAPPAPRIAFRHPLLDRRLAITTDDPVLTDDDLARLVDDYVSAARVARRAGADFVDIKHCHGYLLHELLGAHTRPGRYGGPFENRTRMLREIIAAIRADNNPIEIAVRLSAFDMVPFRPDPALSQPGRPGPGVPEDYSGCLPYRYGFGVNPERPVEPDLAEPIRFMQLCASLGVKILNLTAGSPYYNPHIQRPAAYPPSDGYLPPEDPLVGVARQVQAVRQLKALAPPSLVVIGSAYSYLQEFLPQVAQAVVRAGWVDLVGVGRMALSYPEFPSDAMTRDQIDPRRICRTFSDCTTAPRNGLVSGCYPLDPDYAARPEASQLKSLKRSRPEPQADAGPASAPETG